MCALAERAFEMPERSKTGFGLCWYCPAAYSLFFKKYCPWVYMHGSFHTLKIQLITYFPPLNFRKSATKWVDLSIASSTLDIQIVCVSFFQFYVRFKPLALWFGLFFFWHENCERTKKKPNKTGKKRNVFVCVMWAIKSKPLCAHDDISECNLSH